MVLKESSRNFSCCSAFSFKTKISLSENAFWINFKPSQTVKGPCTISIIAVQSFVTYNYPFIEPKLFVFVIKYLHITHVLPTIITSVRITILFRHDSSNRLHYYTQTRPFSYFVTIATNSIILLPLHTERTRAVWYSNQCPLNILHLHEYIFDDFSIFVRLFLVNEAKRLTKK